MALAVQTRLDADGIRSYDPRMSMWRCPHCGTPQPESSRCWVCHRSSTTCSTCRNFRRAVAGQLGYCGLDRRRLPLAGAELRGCWERAAARTEPAPPTTAAPSAIPGRGDPATRLRDFVPVELRRDHRIVVGPPRMRASTSAGSGSSAAPAMASDGVQHAGPDSAADLPAMPTAAVDADRTGARLTLFGDSDR